MPKPHIFILIMLTMALSACSKPADFVFLNGEPGYYDDLKGQWTVVNYWAEWCKPCIKELPELNRLDKNHDDIRVVGINFDAPAKETLLQQAERFAISFDNVLLAESRSRFTQRFGYEKPKALPTTVIIAPDLNLKAVLQGPQDEAGLREKIDQLKTKL